MKTRFVFTLLVYLSAIYSTQACLREYDAWADPLKVKVDKHQGFPVFYRSFDTKYSEVFVSLFDLNNQESISFRDLYDVAVHLAKLKRFDESLNLLIWLYQQKPYHPGLLMNLGTVYDLVGKPDSAYYYIQKSIETNPYGYHHHEWVHLAALNAKIKLKNNPDWIQDHHILNLYLDYDKEFSQTVIQSIKDTIGHINTYLSEQIPFSKTKDDIIGNITYELGVLLQNHVSFKKAYLAFQLAEIYDKSNLKLIRSRLSDLNQKFEELEFKYGNFKKPNLQDIYPSKSSYKKIEIEYHKYAPKVFQIIRQQQEAKEKTNSYFKIILILFGIIMLFLSWWKSN